MDFRFQRVTALITTCVLVVSTALIITSCNKEKESSSSGIQETTSYESKVETTTVVTTTTEKPLVLLPEAEEELAKNKDAVGWITIKNLVDEPIVQAEDNDYYLYRGYNGKNSEAGTVYADFRNIMDGSKTSDNIVLYGHSQKDGSRFGAIQRTRWNVGVFKNNQTMHMRTNYEERSYKLYAVFLTNTVEKHDNGVVFDYHNVVSFKSESEFNDFKEEVDKRNMIQTGTDYEYGDKIVTLSTCAYDFDDSRFVFMYRQVREGEEPVPSADDFSLTPDPYMPACMYGYKSNYKNK